MKSLWALQRAGGRCVDMKDYGHLPLLPPHGQALLKQQQVEDASGQGETMASQEGLTLVRPTQSCEIITLSKGLYFFTSSTFSAFARTFSSSEDKKCKTTVPSPCHLQTASLLLICWSICQYKIQHRGLGATGSPRYSTSSALGSHAG